VLYLFFFFGAMNRPKSLVCYLCGQGFGTASLAIHQPQCHRKKLAQWEVGDPRTRGPKPVDPASRSPAKKSGKMTASDIDQFNTEQFNGYTESLSPCPHCGRKFNPQSLQVHLRSCRPGNTARPVKGPGDSSPSDGPGSPDGPEDLSGLIPCRKCGRRFVADRIAVHENACLSLKSRKKFNAVKQRIQGTDMEGIRRTTQVPKKPPSVWRQQHQEFIQALRYAKKLTAAEAAGVSLKHLPPLPPSSNPDYVQCPHCGRRFNQTAAERHIPSCATTVNRPKPPPKLRHPSPTPAAPHHLSPPREGTAQRQPSPAGPSLTRRSPATAGRTPTKSPPSRGLSPSVSPKHCHNCGFCYPAPAVKFCSDCGTKRL